MTSTIFMYGDQMYSIPVSRWDWYTNAAAVQLPNGEKVIPTEWVFSSGSNVPLAPTKFTTPPPGLPYYQATNVIKPDAY